MRFIKYLAIIVVAALVFPTLVSADISIHQFTQAIEKSPADMKYKFYLLRGKAYRDSGEMDLALEDLNNSIMLNPSRAAYMCRGEIFFDMGKYADAINDYTAAININPSFDLYKQRGEAYLKVENYVLALADGLNIIDMDPRKPESYYVTIEALENLGDIKLARELAFKVTSFDRGNKKANEIITKYPLKFVFIGESPITIYISAEDNETKDKANEIFLRYKKGEKLDENIKNKLEECSTIGGMIIKYQTRLKETWDNYFEEVRLLKDRTVRVHNELRNKYQKKSNAIEHDIDKWEKKSQQCTEELVQAFWSHI
jgi:tetratricopeptide (TPR) repeat protein